MDDVLPTESDVIDQSLTELVEKTLSAPATQEDALEIAGRLDALGGQIERTSAHLIKTVKNQQQRAMYNLLRLCNQRMSGLAEKVSLDNDLHAQQIDSVRNSNRKLYENQDDMNIQIMSAVRQHDAAMEHYHVNSEVIKLQLRAMVDCNAQFIREQKVMTTCYSDLLKTVHKLTDEVRYLKQREASISANVCELEEENARQADLLSSHTYDIYHCENRLQEDGQDLEYLTRSLRDLREKTDPVKPEPDN